VTKKSLNAVFKDVARLFGKLHSSNSDNEKLTALAMIEKKLEKAGLHIADLGSFLLRANEDLSSLFDLLLAKDVDILVKLARAESKFFSDDEGRAYADLTIDGFQQTLAINGAQYKRWLISKYYAKRKQSPPKSALQQCLATLDAVANFDEESSRHEVYLRIARHGDCIFLDLGDRAGTIVEITPSGWGIIPIPPVRFRRTPSMTALPIPQSGGSIELLRPFVNLDNNAFILFVCALVDALFEGRPHPVFFLSGEEGVTKSTLAKIARMLIDPNKVKPKSLPTTVRDLFVDLDNSYAATYDNISVLTPKMSDALCMAATGTGFSTRKLYTDSELTLLGGQTRPIWMTGLKNVITRSDLADRAIILTLDYLPEAKRKTEEEYDYQFEQKRPLILGALLDLVSHALKNLPHVRPPVLPRMADFARIAAACETGFTKIGSFAAAYASNAQEATQSVIEEQSSGVALAILAFMEARQIPWQGTATTLLTVLTLDDRTEQCVTKASTWPKNHQTFGTALAEAASSLRKTGVLVTKSRKGHKCTRMIQLELREPADKQTSQTSRQATSEINTQTTGSNGTAPPENPNRTLKTRN
jgi:hypothetical protein